MTIVIGPDWIPLHRAAQQSGIDEQLLLLAAIAGEFEAGDNGTVMVDPATLKKWIAMRQLLRLNEDRPNGKTRFFGRDCLPVSA